LPAAEEASALALALTEGVAVGLAVALGVGDAVSVSRSLPPPHALSRRNAGIAAAARVVRVLIGAAY
jgi:hypothetical protein